LQSDQNLHRQTDSAPFYIHLPQHGLHKKSVLSLVPRLTTRCCPHPQLGCLRLLIDRQYVTSAAVDICCMRPSSAANQPHIAAAVDRQDRQTDRHRPFHCTSCTAYYAGSVSKQTSYLEYSGISLNMRNSGNYVQPQGKTVTNKVVLFRRSNICVKL